MTSERDPEAVDIEIEIRAEHQPILHGTQPCPSGGCCSCGAIGGCSTGLALRFLDEERAALAAAEREVALVREQIAADPGESTLDALDFWFVEKQAMERSAPGLHVRAEKAESALATERATSQRLADELDWEKHCRRCGQCGDSYRPLCPTGRLLKEALSAAPPPAGASDGAALLSRYRAALEAIIERRDGCSVLPLGLADAARIAEEALSATPPPAGASDDETPCHVCGVPIAMVCDDCLADIPHRVMRRHVPEPATDDSALGQS